MSRKDDLEINIRESYGLICDYEQIQQNASDPKEKKRAERNITEQWQLIQDYLVEYSRLCDSLRRIPSPDIAEIAASAGLPLSSAFTAIVCPGCGFSNSLGAHICGRCAAKLRLISGGQDVEIEVQGAHAEDVAHVVNETIRQLKPAPPENGPQGNAFALLVGIAAYRSIRPLSKTVTDARDLHDVLLKNGHPTNNMALLCDSEATKAAISDRLEWLARCAGPNDTVVIFFSGHGAQYVGGFWPGEYLCPVEATLDKVKETLIATDEFSAALKSIRAGRLVVFLDACHAGGIGETKDPGTQVKAGLTDSAYSLLSQGQGRVVIASCRPDEVSYELSGMRNSLFTHYLLEGLRGGAAGQDGAVWVTGLFGYVYQQASQHNLQHPFLKSASEDFILAQVGSSAQVSASIS